jgi:RNA recognition motif-containing protein
MRLFVSNLGSQVTNESLGALFATHGTVDSIRIFFDDQTGRSKGLALVEMQNRNQAAQAIARINGSIVDGHVIDVKEAEQKSETEYSA